MARLNPVRGHYLLVGTDLIKAGIRTLKDAATGTTSTVIARENSGSVIFSVDPASERWITSRAVGAAAAKAGVPLDMASVEAAVILPYLKADPKARVRTTADQIVHMLGKGDTPEARQFADAQVALLEATYNGQAAASSAA